MRSTAVLFFFALVMPPVSVLGQSSGDGVVTKTLKVELPPGEVKRDYSAESVVVERLDTVYRFAADGTGVREISAVTLIQSDAAARQYGVLTFPFAGNNEHVEFEYVRVRKPDGSVVETPAADAQEMPQEVTRQAPFYSDLKEKQIPVRNLRVGDRLEYKTRIVVTKAEVPGQFWGQESFGQWAVILNENIELHVPKGKYVKVWSPEHAPAKTETGDETVYRWTGANLEPLIGKDGKAKRRETDPKGELPALAWTTFKSWDEVGAWYRGLEADRVIPDAEVKAKAAELTAGKTTEEDKARALYGYVATQIRYIGVAFGIGRYQPHPAGEVLRNQYGDCKDKHTLLAAMLTAAGLHPEAALIGAGVRMNEEVPSPGAFNHMVTTVPVAGKPVWLDATAEVAPYQMLVSTIRDKEALVVPETGAAKLEKTPEKLPFAPFARFVAKGTLSKDGTMKAQMEYTARGDDELVLRALLKQVPPGQWDELTQRISQGLGFGGTTSHTEATKPDATSELERLAYDYEREKAGDWDNLRIVPLFPVVFITSVDDKNPPKKIPIELGEPRVETSISIIKLPAGWGADLPTAVHQKTAFASFDKTYKVEGDTLTTERRVEVFQRQVPAADWKAYKKWYDAALGDGEGWIQLTSSGSDPMAKEPPAAHAVDDPNVNVLRMAAIAVGRNDLKTAREELDIVKASKPDQPGLWRMYSLVDSKEGKEEASTQDLERELKAHQTELYGIVVQMHLNQKHRSEAKETLKLQIDRQPEAMKPVLRLAQLLMEDGEPKEASRVLEAASTRAPTDSLHPAVVAQLGISQLKAGDKDKGAATLSALLKSTDDLGILNDAAYELADSGLEISLAEKSARKAVDTLTAQSADWTLDGDAKIQAAKTNLLVAAWDTVGWILYRQGKPEEAEGYVQAAWQNHPWPEIGLHLGQIKEARGEKRAALAIYEIAQRNSRASAKEINDELKRRVDTLTKASLSLADKEIADSLHATQRLRVNNPDHVSGIADYEILLSGGKAIDVRPMPDAATHITGGAARILSIDFKSWTPPASAGKIKVRGLLNCHRDFCEMERLPL